MINIFSYNCTFADATESCTADVYFVEANEECHTFSANERSVSCYEVVYTDEHEQVFEVNQYDTIAEVHDAMKDDLITSMSERCHQAAA